MTFIVQNWHDYDIKVGSVTLPRHDQIVTHELTEEISDAALRGDVKITFADDAR